MATLIGGDLDTPTTGALFGNALYAPDSKFRDCGGGADCSEEDFYVYRLELENGNGNGKRNLRSIQSASP